MLIIFSPKNTDSGLIYILKNMILWKRALLVKEKQ